MINNMWNFCIGADEQLQDIGYIHTAYPLMDRLYLVYRKSIPQTPRTPELETMISDIQEFVMNTEDYAWACKQCEMLDRLESYEHTENKTSLFK